MQQTPIDHFLKDRYVYVYEVKTARIPRRLPWGVTIRPAPRMGQYGWNFVLRCKNAKVYKGLVNYLRRDSLLYEAQIVERKTMLSRWLNPKGQDSFTYNTIWSAIRVGFVGGFLNIGIRVLPSEAGPLLMLGAKWMNGN